MELSQQETSQLRRKIGGKPAIIEEEEGDEIGKRVKEPQKDERAAEDTQVISTPVNVNHTKQGKRDRLE